MRLCLISCNIRFDNPADGKNAWANRQDFLSHTLLNYDPTIIATQEGRFTQLHEFKNTLKSFDLVDQHRCWIKERMYPSFFTKEGQFELLASGDIWLSETPEIAGSLSFGSAFPRLMTWAKVQLKESDQTLMLINTHLDHIQEQTRIAQIGVLIHEVKRLWDKKSALVIMGDFNDSPHSKVRSALEENFPFLQDAWRKFHPVEESSHHAFKGETQNGSRIDWIMVDKKFSVENCLMDKSSKNGLYPTDHYPVICTLSI